LDVRALPEPAVRLGALIARAIRHRHEEPVYETLQYDDLVLCLTTHVVRRGERRIELTRTEFNPLELFLRNPGRVLPRALISKSVWGFDFGSMSNSLTVYIGYLRRKTEAAGEPRLIHTVRGVGYVLREPDSVASSPDS
jgi:two-component system response regulator MprA